MMKRLQLHRLRYWWKSFGFKGLRFWLSDIKGAHERCTYCGNYLHPQLLFKGIKRPMKHTYWKLGDDFVCASCADLAKRL